VQKLPRVSVSSHKRKPKVSVTPDLSFKQEPSKHKRTKSQVSMKKQASESVNLSYEGLRVE
jgi:hypothetical protein